MLPSAPGQGAELKILIVGAGVVGKTTGKGFEVLGHEVYYQDINETRMEELAAHGRSTWPPTRWLTP